MSPSVGSLFTVRIHHGAGSVNGIWGNGAFVETVCSILTFYSIMGQNYFYPPHISPASTVISMLHRVLKRAGLPKVRFHDLRHTFATLALQNGVDVKTVSGMLGRFSAGFTLDTYAHITSAAQRQAAQTMGSVLAGTIQCQE